MKIYQHFGQRVLCRTFALVAALVILFAAAATGLAQHTPHMGAALHLVHGRASEPPKRNVLGVEVAQGDDAGAKLYYSRIAAKLNFPFDVDSTSLDDLLEYCGYIQKDSLTGNRRGLLAKDIELLASNLLMPADQAAFDTLASKVSSPDDFRATLKLEDFVDGKVLVTRFFAPKIATYFDPVDSLKPINRDQIVPGWRKAVRIKPKPTSTAVTSGKLKHVYLLFNYKRADASVDPFEGNESKNNQVILVPNSPAANEDTSYFAVFKSRSNEYKMERFLAADFDVPGANDELGKYYVPTACAACHGHGQSRGKPNGAVFDKAKPNYLDTDQWYDWMDYDFRGVATSLNDVVFDGGKDQSSPGYRAAFDVIRKLNADILIESTAAVGSSEYSTLAAQKWLDLHPGGGGANDSRKPYSSRSIGTENWNAATPAEMRLLSLLDNHCFRCHSSMIYNIFDKKAVISRKVQITNFLNLKKQDSSGQDVPGYFMPQGRVLTDSDRLEILRLLKQVSESTGSPGGGGGTPSIPTPNTHEITIKDFAFSPPNLEMKVGDSVVWINKDGSDHNAQRDELPLKFRVVPDGRVIAPGAPPEEFYLRTDERSQPIVFSQTTDASGIEYFCEPHQGFMSGIIIVKP